MNSERSSSVGKFSIERIHLKVPLHLLHTRKVSQLEGKVQFFEGQVDPLHSENSSLKEQLIVLTKMVSSSADLLRNLLPNQHPTRKLKLQLATITEISEMIKQDWLVMQAKLVQNAESIQVLTQQREDWHQQFNQEHELRETQVRQLEESKARLKEEFQGNISDLRKEIGQLQKKHETDKESMKADFQRKMKLFQFSVKEYQLFKHETKKKEEDYDKAIERLKEEIQANLVSFEENKKNLKQIYDKLMTDKLGEQAEGYDLLLKIREEEKISLLMQIADTEEENKRKLTQKDFEIIQLNDIASNFKIQIGSLKDTNWKHQLTIDKHIAQQKELHTQITAIKEAKKVLEQKIELQRQENMRQKIQFQLKLRKQDKQIQIIKKEGSNALKMLLDEKKKVEVQLQETTASYKKTMSILSKTEAQFNSKISKMKEEWAKEEEILKQTISQTEFNLEEHIKSLKFSQLVNEDLIRQHCENVRQLKDHFKMKEDEIVFNYDNKLASLALQSQQKLQDLQRKHDHELREASIAANEEMKQTIIDCNKKLAIQATNYQLLLEEAKKKEENIQNRLLQAQKIIRSNEKQKENIMNKHLKELKLLEQQKEQEKQELNEEIEKQMKEFQRSLEEKETELSNIKQVMQKQIKMLKEANAIDSVEHFYQNEINKLKTEFNEKCQEMSSEFKQEFQRLSESSKNSIQQLVSSHHLTIQEMKNSFNKDLSKIAKKTQEEDTFLKDKILDTGENFENMSPEDKINSISHKIAEMKVSVADKQIKIGILQKELKDMENHIEVKIKARREELEKEKDKAIKDCQQKIAKATEQCNVRVTTVEQDRLEHSLLMREEFQRLKMTHNKEINCLQKRYSELQILFEERPSRMEDLTKIKELINLQSKRDIEIQSYQKKMETANEIVKYLNLQLSNYKDAYDIFGPNSENKEIGIVGQSAIKIPQYSNYQNISEPQQFMEVIKTRKQEKREIQPKKTEDNRTTLKQSLSFRNNNDAPFMKEFKMFEDNQNSDQVIFQPQLKLQSQKKNRRYSNLIPEKSSERRERFKTQKTQKQDSEAEIMMNAQNFIRLIKGGELSNPVIRQQQEAIKKKGYRKRKVNKRNPTVGFSQYL